MSWLCCGLLGSSGYTSGQSKKLDDPFFNVTEVEMQREPTAGSVGTGYPPNSTIDSNKEPEPPPSLPVRRKPPGTPQKGSYQTTNASEAERGDEF